MYWLNLIIPALIFLPNLLLFRYPPANEPQEPVHEPLSLKVIEWVGRIGLIITPLFTPYSADSVAGEMAFMALVVFLLIYYAGWIRFFRNGRIYEYLYLPMLEIPIPMAIAPVVYFLYASFLLQSAWVLISAVIFGTGHIIISLKNYRAIKMDSGD